MRVHDYNNFKLENKIDKYFSGEITLEQVNIDYYLLSVNEKWSDKITDRLITMLFKAMEGVKQVAKQGKKVLTKILKFLWKIAKGIGRVCDKYKKVCMFTILVILMITVGAVSTYAAANPTDPNIVEIANAALGYLDQITGNLEDSGINFNNINLAKSMLTEIRDGGGSDIDYTQISKEANALAQSAIKVSQQMAKDDPDQFAKFAEIGAQMAEKFTYIVNGAKTIIGHY